MRPRAFPPRRHPAGELASIADLQKLETLRQALVRLTSYRRDGAPLGYRWGLLRGR